MKARRIVIKGKVHDVGYRLFLLSEAERLLIEKFDARNVLVNGEQHLIVLIKGAEEGINRFVAFAESNYPPEASVKSVEVEDYSDEVMGVDSFRQSFMVFQLTKIAQVGVGMLNKQDKMLDKQDTMIDKQDKTIAILESVKGDTSKMIEKQDETVRVIKEESQKNREAVCDESEKTREVLKTKIEEDVEYLKEEIIGVKVTLEKVKEKVGMA
ncbi:hypothetical protein C5S31_07305 [ANME-1 cluster archaeon GoMg2]|nr:hypothetical protein [ANME-1 cluster archaeon GoMg2]